MQGSKPNALIHKIPVSLSQGMKVEVEKESDVLGISEQGFLRLCVRLYFKSGGLRVGQIGLLNDDVEGSRS